MIYTGGDGDDKMMGIGRGWGRCGDGERIMGMGMKFIAMSFSGYYKFSPDSNGETILKIG